MSDVYELQLHLDLTASTPANTLTRLRRHLGLEPWPDGAADDGPLLAARGPAARISGVLVGELAEHPPGWSLTARQEIHPDQFQDLHLLLKRLAAHTGAPGPIGQLRFLEDHIPDLIVPTEDGEVTRLPLTAPPPGTAVPFLEDLGW
ncbi:hypothetical protein LIX60_22115 [Streptomyces sp. S07_1.15]|uniref:hypothetical protein n=1 Tax=Streptomyces sp. S07_1.15 TaxID=2873925 RepID=UPI001D13EDC9|nr:hypothetical protein [Streptomyces sp. S07_1.15]MCC3654109.1 hypothetical protein [Streptomyces sp. S07_1.15]